VDELLSLPGRVGIADCRDARHAAEAQTAPDVDGGQRPETVEVELAQVGDEAVQRRYVIRRGPTVPVSFAGEVVQRPEVAPKRVRRTDVGRVDVDR